MPGPKLPAANTGTMPTATGAMRRSSWNSRLHPGLLKVHELLTTAGASGVPGLPSGIHQPLESQVDGRGRGDVRLSLKILTAIHCAAGATPTEVPPASPPTITPIVQVPWPLRSVGVVGCWP